MSATVILIVLAAALLHATWNALIKGAEDRAVMLGLVAAGHVLPACFVALYVPLPAPEAWPYIIASTVIHWVYYWLLIIAYRHGDLSVVYPIARGAAPLLVALGAWAWVGEALPLLAWIGIATISAGIFLLARPSRLANVPRTGILAAMGVAVMVAAYSVADGAGVRVSGHAVSYVAWLFVAEIFVAVFVLVPRRKRLMALGGRTIAIGLAGGIISATAYAMALYAKTLAPIGVVSAMRETSVLFAALIGTLWFGEGPRGKRIGAACVVTLGVIITALI